MSGSAEYWRRFWQAKDDPLHRSSSSKHYDDIASELKLILPDPKALDVFEIGCGNGALYERLGFDHARYFGVDLSEAMVARFRADYPGASVEVGDAMSFPSGAYYDLVFSNGVIQYLTLDEFSVHLLRAKEHLKPGGRVIHSAVPWNALRWTYRSGQFEERAKNLPRRLVAEAAYKLRLKKDKMGTWYGLRGIRRAGRRAGLSAAFYGSICNPYRFHVLFI